MKKHFFLLLLLASTATAFAQDILFVGLFNNPESSSNYWCRGMEMVKQTVKTEAEAQQLAVDFKKEHDKDSPITKIFKSGSVILYDFIKEDKAFKCSYRVIGWKQSKSKVESRELLVKDEDRIKKEYNGKPNELYAWEGTGVSPIQEISLTLEGISILFKRVNNNGAKESTWVATVTNPLKEKMAYVVFLLDDVRNPSDYKESFKLQPGEILNVNLGKGISVDVLVRLGKKDEPEDGPGVIYQLKNYIRQKVIENKGKLETKGAPFSVRG